MTNDHDELPAHLTFSQRYGYEPLPESMKLEEISDDLRREIWNEVRAILLEMQARGGLGYYFPKESARIIERVLGKYLRISENRVNTDYTKVMLLFEKTCSSAAFNKVLELLEAIINDREAGDDLVERIRCLFELHGAAYQLDSSQRGHLFIPTASKEQAAATRQAVEVVELSGVAPGAVTHLRRSVQHLNAGHYADSIRESIHSVESVARVIDPEANKDLGKALDSLEKVGVLRHPALKKGFKNLFGYTSDEQGVRHALLERDAPGVDVDDALFMYGACASFAAYLVNGHQKASDS